MLLNNNNHDNWIYTIVVKLEQVSKMSSNVLFDELKA